MLPSNSDLLTLLARLDEVSADALESEWLDFKPWTGTKEDMKVAVEYAVCFANAGGGVVVFGVDDKPVGRMKAIHGAKGYDLERWRRDIFDSTRPNLAVEVFELAVPEGTGKVLGVRVEAGGSKPYGTASGVFKQRAGKSCMPLEAYLHDHGSISPKVCRELLGLGESQSAKVEASRYLKAWSTGDDAFLSAQGHAQTRRYFLRTRGTNPLV